MGRIFATRAAGAGAVKHRRIQREDGQKDKARQKDRSFSAEQKAEAKRRRYKEAREKREENRENIALSIATIDFETDPFSHGIIPRPFACGFATVNGYESIWGTEEEVLEFARRKTGAFEGYVFAHNGGKFDFPDYLLKNSGKYIRGEKALLINGRLVKMRFGRAEIRDSFAILPAGLSAFDKGDIDYNKLHKNEREKHRSEILTYLGRDCRSLHTLVTEFVVQNGIKAITAASAALASMRELCTPVDNLTQSQDANFRKYYFGGRVEVFQPGIHSGRFIDYDIKSAYPHAMLSEHCVSNEFDFIARPKADAVKDTDFVCYTGFAKGCFPVREKTGLRFPHSNASYHITGWEFNTARRLGLLGSGRVEFIERPVRIANFADYVTHHYEAKEKAEREGNKALRLISKILINSGYGKLAQDPEDWREYVFMLHTDVIPEPNTEGWEEEICNDSAGYAVWSRPTQTPGNYYNVAAAASITGFVRARIIEAAHGRRIYYCDTDSVTLHSGDVIATGDSLGDFTVEEHYDMLMLGGKKLYAKRISRKSCPNRKAFDKMYGDARNTYHWWKNAAWKIASKGAKLTPKDLFSICHGKTVTYRSEAPSMTVKAFTHFVTRNIRATVTLPNTGKNKQQYKTR